MKTKFFIPENLDLEGFLATHRPKFKFKKDKFAYILNLLTEIPAHNKKFRTRDFIPINAQRLQGVVHDYLKYINYLIEHSILESDAQYIVDEKSIGYRFADKYRSKVKPVPITDFTLRKGLQKQRTTKPCREYPHLRKWFNSSLQIDAEGAVKYLDSLYTTDTQAGNKKASQAYNASFVAINQVADQEFHFSVDPTGHRLHTNLTHLKKGLRDFIDYEGHPLVSIDICNSQPLLSSLLLTSEFYTSTTSTPISFNYINSKLNNTIIIPPDTLSSTIMLVKSQEIPENKDKSDFSNFIQKVTEGNLYEYIQDKLASEDPPVHVDRSKVKEMLFTVFFSDNRFFAHPDAYPKRLFYSVFPNVYKVFCNIKTTAKRNLAVLLQNIESHIILDFVVKRITNEQKALPLFTIHDSVVTTAGNEEYFSTVMKEEILRCIGISPTLKIEKWEPEGINLD